MSRSFLALGLSLVFALSAKAQLPPDKAIQSFKVSDGLEISLWASEPLFVNPTCMDVDHKGRVWISESINYRQKLRGEKKMRRPEGDRLLVLEDTQGTGRADKVTVFYQAPEIHAPLGIAVRPNTDGIGCTVYVCQSPDIWLLEDKDGDNKADGPPRKLLTGFKGLDHDHGVHGILIGPDNRLYFTVGDAGVSNLQSSDGTGPKYSSNSTDLRAATVWRCDLDGKNLELIAHNFRNNYEPCVDSFGTVFLSDNDDDGNQQTRLCYVMQGGNYGYHHSPKTSHWNEEHPGIVPKILRTYFGSPTGICMYEGALFPKAYQGQVLHVDAGPRHARCYHLTPHGAAYKVEREDMVESTDNWFRASDICVAPDGSVFIADWYDPGVGGHGMGDIKMGRIYRVAPKGSKSGVPKIDLKSKEGLTAALASPNLAVRAVAMTRIRELGLPKALEVLEPAAQQKADLFLRARALWQLGYLGNLRNVTQAFEDGDPQFRILAMRILHDAKGQTPVDYTLDWQANVLKDPSASVQREALLLLQKADAAKAKPMILELAKQYDGADRFYLAAIGIAVGHHDQKRRDLMLADFEKVFPEWNDRVAGLMWELRPRQMLPLLERRLAEAKLPEKQRGQVVDILLSSDDNGAAQVLLRALSPEASEDVRDKIVAGLRTHLPGKWSFLAQNTDLTATITRLLEHPKTQVAGLNLIGAARKGEFQKQALGLAADAKQPASVRSAALQALGDIRTPEASQGVYDIYMKETKDVLKAEALQALGRQGTTHAQTILQTILQQKGSTLAARQAAVAGLAANKEGAVWLLRAYEGKNLDKDLTADLSRLLRNSPFPNVKKPAQALLPAPPKLDPKQLPTIQALLARKGNSERGRSVMEKTLKNDAACMKCHTINKVGGAVGPELSVIGSKASRENLLESILYPHRAVADQYIQWIVETKGGVVVSGLIIEETPDYLLLRDVNAKDHKVSRKDLESKTKALNSIMPDNLLLFMSEDDLLDIVDYLYSLKSPTLG